MLAIPLKYTEPVDLVTPIRNYLLTKYPKSEVEQYQDSLTKLQSLRNDVAAIRTSNTGARETLYKYFSQLPSAMDKFNITESSTTGLRIGFTWTDTLTATRQTQYSWIFEMANVAYNIAWVESELVTNIRRDTQENITTARNGLNLAAGIIAYVRDHIANRLLGTIPLDLRPDGINLYYNLLLAQSQVCFYELARFKQMNSATLSKVAVGAVNLFRSAAETLTNPQDKWTAERIYPFHAYCESFAALFDAASFFRYSEVILQQTTQNGTGYGARCAWLIAAEAACNQAIAKPLLAEKNLISVSKGKTINVSPATIDTKAAKDLLQELVPLRQEAVHDNERIYREVVPKFAELPILPSAILATPTPFPEIRPEQFGLTDLFAGIVPAELATSLVTVPDRLTVKANQWKERVTKATDEARSVLQSFGLPGALEANNGGTAPGLPSNIADRVNRCQMEGGINELDRLWFVIVKNASLSNDLIRQVDSVLSEEIETDQSLRNRIGEQRYTATKAEIVIADLRAESDKYSSLVQAASSSDQQLYARLEAYRPLLQILSRSRTELDATIPNPPPISGNTNTATEGLLNVLRTNVKELETLMDNRNQLVQSIRETYDKPAVMELLKKSTNPSEHGTLLDNYFSKTVSAPETELEHNLNSQSRLLEQITVAYNRWNEVRALDERTKARDRAIQNICESVDKFEEIRSNLREGETFWSELQHSINLLLQNCKDMLAARNMQRKEILLRLSPVVSTSNGSNESKSNGGSSSGSIGYPSLSGNSNSNNGNGGMMMDRSLSNSMNTNGNNNYGSLSPHSGGMTTPSSWATFDPTPMPPSVPSYPSPSYPPMGTGPSFMSTNNNNLVPPTYPPSGMMNTNYNNYNTPSWNTNNNAPPSNPSTMSSTLYNPMVPSSNPSSSFIPPSSAVNPNVTNLMGMGFSRDKVERALAMHNNNFESALNQLLTE